jgi:ribonuclease-3
MFADLQPLCQLIGYSFKDMSLLKLALTHRSANPNHNERLEFIGDSIVNLVIGEALYLSHSKQPEGELSRWRASLVQRETLAELARLWQLDKFIRLGPGESKTQGQQRPSILSNTFEAILGALYFDGGFQATKEIILKAYGNKLSSLSIKNIEKDAKTLLQEWLQAQHHPLPIYEVVATEGQDHATTFKVCCKLCKLNLSAYGSGTSKRKAEQDAAQKMLDLVLNNKK